MLENKEGLTATYNRFHDPAEQSAAIVTLRQLHVELDQAVAAAYGWQELPLSHGFHETAQGTRYTISEAARRQVLTRLLKLNHQRYAEEQEEKERDEGRGMRDEGKKLKGKRKKSGKKKDDGENKQMSLFG